MYTEGEPVYYYLTVTNEKYAHPELPPGSEAAILAGLHRIEEAEGDGPPIRLLGSGAILREVRSAAETLRADYGLSVEVYSATSFNELRREAADVLRWNRLHPTAAPRRSHVETLLGDSEVPVVAVTDYVANYAEQIRGFIPGPYAVLGTDGYGRSDSREKLRDFFEVDALHVVWVALSLLGEAGTLAAAVAEAYLVQSGIDPEKRPPRQS